MWTAAWAAGLACLARPLANPDLFWHLSSARRMLELRAVPAADWLSWSKEGAAWVDFEWLSQLVYGAAWAMGGIGALWALKVLLLLACFALVDRLGRLHDLAPPWRAGVLAAWSCLMLPRSDLRPDLFSALLFGWLLLRLEERRLGRGPGPRPWACAGAFALAANLHAGFPCGLALLGLYGAGDAAAGRRPPLGCLAAALAGTFANPSGPAVWRILAQHGAGMGSLSRHITEWGPVSFGDPWRWPHWLLVAAVAAAALRSAGSWRRTAVPIAAMAALAWLGTAHQRLGLYLVQAGLPLAAHLLSENLPAARTPGPAARAAVLGALLASIAYLAWCSRGTGLGRTTFMDGLVPRKAAAFLAREADVLGPRRAYAMWQWGGYLGWRLYPRGRVFHDGRYLFHDLLDEETAAMQDPGPWGDFLRRRAVDVALLPNLPAAPSEGGTRVAARRPYYRTFMPEREWALVHFDPLALVFVRREALPAAWVERREYRVLRPNDGEALRVALASGQVSAGLLQAERRRHDELDAALAAEGRGF